jgi:glycosyltransferase involved in cell wall biosynthesis
VTAWHLVTPEFPPMIGGVSEHSRVLAQMAGARGLDVHVWAPAAAGTMAGIEVHATLGGFSPSDLARTGMLIDAFAPPRDLLVQWVPHGFGYRGMNAQFARWLAGRAAAGDRIDVVVHEPFVDFFGGSWTQPVRAVIQRYMARTALRSARRIWMSIPGWESRLAPLLDGRGAALRVLPISGTIPVASSAGAEGLKQRLLGGRRSLVGYFGTGGAYAETALAHTVAALLAVRHDVMFICIGRGSEEVAAAVRRNCNGADGLVHATGAVDLTALSHHLAACDVLLQPYVDGVSGRRTTTISALEHGVPVATTLGRLSEPFWSETQAVQGVPAATPVLLAGAVERLLSPARNAVARSAARTLYAARFEPGVALAPLFAP